MSRPGTTAILRSLGALVLCLGPMAPSVTQAIGGIDLNAVTDDTVWYDNDCASSNSTTTVSGDNNAVRAFNFFIGKGLTNAQAAGIVGNMIEESGVGPERLQGTQSSEVTKASFMVSTGLYQTANVGWGIVQWTPADQPGNGVIITTKNPSDAVNTLSYQLDALWTELQGPKKNALNAIKADTTVAAATNDWLNLFEIGAPSAFREVAAQAMYELATSHKPLPPAVYDSIVPESAANPGNGSPSPSGSPSPGISCSSPTPGPVTGCADPFRKVEGGPAWQTQRIDQGIDYAAVGPIFAVCSGNILNLTNSGWCYVGGCAFIAIKFDSGPLKNLVSYMAEGCAPVVHIGQHVTSETVICNMGPGEAIETGWADGNALGKPLAQDYGGNGCCSTTAGVSYNKFLKSLGTPSGNLTNPPIGQPLPPPYP